MSRRISSLSSFSSDKPVEDIETALEAATSNFKRPRTLAFSAIFFDLPTRSGWLQKKSPKFFIGWQWRYFELKDKRLYYFKNTVGRKPKGVINFDLVTIDIVDVRNSCEFILVPQGCSRKFRIRAENEALKLDWLSDLNAHLITSEGRSRKMTRIAGVSEWWRIDRISEMQFLKSADTGDILLFRSQDTGAKIQRALTMSKYDHVAMIIRYATGELALLESTSLDGVSIVRWEDFIEYRWHLLYNMIVFRHLEANRNDEMVQNLEDFICKVKGMQYLLNPMGIIKQRDPSGPDQGFFCSQLVAAAYKAMGVLHSGVASVSVLPGHFSYEQTLLLIDRAFLCEEQLVDFDLVV